MLVIAAKLLVPEDESDEIAAGTTLWHAIRIVVIADIVMSLDNVIAVAAAAKGNYLLLGLGLALRAGSGFGQFFAPGYVEFLLLEFVGGLGVAIEPDADE